MPGFGWVSFTTDYGLAGGFVGICHGVIARLAPHVRVIDVTHEVPPGDVRHGALLLAQTLPQLPPAIHVAVVDPGVGTSRRPVALVTPGGVLVGPDNGLLPWAGEALGGVAAAVVLTNPRWFADRVSPTFHGRDIFAPVAAELATATALAGVGPSAGSSTVPVAEVAAVLSEAGAPMDPAELLRLPEPVVDGGDGWLAAEVLWVDRFGNVQLAASGADLARLPAQVRIGEHPAVRGETFADAPEGELVVLVDSAGQVAVAANRGDAARMLAVGSGELVRIDSRR